MAWSRGSSPRRLPTDTWHLVPGLVEAHGLAALVTAGLADEAPPGQAAALRDLLGRTVARGRRLAADRRRLRLALDVAGIEFSWLKGAWLAERGLVAWDRPAADIDLQVAPASIPAAAAVLATLGYAETASTARHRRFLRLDNRRVVEHRGEHPDNPRPVEIHPIVGESFRGLRLDLTGAPSRRHLLEDASAVVHLAAHTTADALGRKLRGRQLVDLAVAADALDGVGWRRVADLCAAHDAGRFVWPGLTLARHHAAARVPPRLLDTIGAGVKSALRDWVLAADVDSLSRLARGDARRPLGEIPRVWPRGRGEALAVWRFILMPGRWELADRYPALAASPRWPLLYLHHAVYTVRRLAARLRTRPEG